MTVAPRAAVLLPLPVKGAYDYVVPDGMGVGPGDFVTVPLGVREVTGVVWRYPSPTDLDAETSAKLKPILERLPAPPLTAELIDFVDWVAAYALFPPGAVLRMVMRSGRQLTPPRPKTGYVLSGVQPQRLTPARGRVLAAASATNPLTAAELAEAAECGASVVRGLAEAETLRAVEIAADAPYPEPALDGVGPTLSTDQDAAAEKLRAAVASGAYAPVLIDGVTGSGKTEVYFEAAAAALAQDPTAQVLVMLPEIALTLAFLKRVEARFGVRPALWHSDVGDKERGRVWRKVAEGQARLVAGARSALFLPFRNLRLIIVDEEHDAAYKQEDGVVYQARDMAVARAARGRFPIALASATPSLETFVNAETGRYAKATLSARFGGAVMPRTEAVDMRADGPEPGRWLSPKLVDALAATFASRRQSMLFLNRRGYAPLTICRKCGHRMTAPDSDTWLVEHRYENRLVCHHTGYSIPKPDRCPKCGAPDALAPCGPGVERVAEEVRGLFPEARMAVFSSDTVQSPKEAQRLLAAMRAGEIDMLVGTQVVAKGHHFPKLTLVGVVDADLGLQGGDLRAAERTFQLLSQVAGRAGREAEAGRALLQSYRPDHAVMRALVAGDRDAFLAEEIRDRKASGFPPFGRLAAIILSSPNEEALGGFARALAQAAPPAEGVEVWGPAPAPISRLRGRARVRFLVKALRTIHIQAYLRAWTSAVKVPAPVRMTIDVDPYSFL
ncbi:MAG: primosomal protein N' [Pseudomonadota bacterium]